MGQRSETMNASTRALPPGQQLAAADKWPTVGERLPRKDNAPWTLALSGLVEWPVTLSLFELEQLPQVERTIDIHCVTRWSKLGVRCGGVLLAELLTRARPSAAAKFASFVARSERSHSTSLPLDAALAMESLVALRVEDRPLSIERGGPVRLIVPGRYFYKSLKWLERIELLAEDRLGYWESTAGYHNQADPWREQRYLAGLSKSEARQILERRDLAGRELLGLHAAGLELPNLRATGAVLRNADFSQCRLRGARFERANLTNARLVGADLRDAKLTHADLEGVEFTSADLRGADLTGASLLAATFRSEPPGEGAAGARINRATRIDPAAVADLTPHQQAYVQARISNQGAA